MFYNLIFFLFAKFFIFFIFSGGFIYLLYLLLLVCLMLCVAFLTVFERKVMGSIQRRRGPSFVGFFGLLQAIADALKLLSKESIIPSSSNYFLFILSPISLFLFSFLCWVVIPFSENIVASDISISMFFIFALSTSSAYSIIMAGWASNSKYAFLGSLRSAAQVISYEVALGLVVLPIFLLSGSANFIEIVLSQIFCWNFWILLPSFILFYFCVLAETNRVPFDLPEAESELVSGYNVEYSSVGFVLFFLSEYLNIILMSVLIVILFFGGWLPFLFLDFFLPAFFIFFLKILFFLYTFVWVRAILPRFRYDQLMSFGWKIILPISLMFLCLFLVEVFLFL